MASYIDKYGRVCLAEGLTISIQRSFQVTTNNLQRPISGIKGMGFIGKNLDENNIDVYEITMHKNDAFWFGFDTENEKVFAIIPCINGHQALTGAECKSLSLSLNPQNYLISADQPWFDCVYNEPKGFQQLSPHFKESKQKNGQVLVKEISLSIYYLSEEKNTAKFDINKPIPLYDRVSSSANESKDVHLWKSRSLANKPLPSSPCAKLVFKVVDNANFEKHTGIQLPMISDDENQSVLPHNPFA